MSKRGCANCGHQDRLHIAVSRGNKLCFAGEMNSDVPICPCRTYRERKSRALLEIQIGDWEYEHNISMLRGLIPFDTIEGSGYAKCEPYGVIQINGGKGIIMRDIKAAAKAKKALKRLAKRKAKRESAKRKRSTVDGRLMNPSAHRSQLRK